MPGIADTYRQLGDRLDMRPNVRGLYERQMAGKGRILDIGGRNENSASAKRLRRYGATEIVSTDVVADYGPDLVDDITETTIAPDSFDGVYCDAVLEHVTDYWSAMKNIHAILKPNGEAFIYVPFMYPFHDRMDYHRFTVSEVARMTERFSESRIFVPGPNSGYGWMALHMLTYGQIERLPTLHARLAGIINWLVSAGVRIRCRLKPADYTADQAAFFATYLLYNHGFCAWMRK